MVSYTQNAPECWIVAESRFLLILKVKITFLDICVFIMDKRQFRRDTLSGDSSCFQKRRYVLKENTLEDKKYVSIYEMLW